MVLGTAVGKLRARVALAAQPARAVGAPPIVIIGGWRTGTTFLFRLLATDPRLRAPRPAELTAPWKLAGLTGEERRARLDAAGGAHDALHLLNPGLAAVHDSGALLPEECVLAMGTDFRNWGFSSTVRLESYSSWLAGQDLAGSYARYRHVLGLLDETDDRRWVLKAPAHTAEPPHLARAFPGAVIVHLHRDPVQTVASGASLFATFRSTPTATRSIPRTWAGSRPTRPSCGCVAPWRSTVRERQGESRSSTSPTRTSSPTPLPSSDESGRPPTWSR
jgi:hypothetical protein